MKQTASEAALLRLLDIMARLRDRNGGCPWDLEQTFATIAPYTIEEAYEVADAIERGELAELKDELGDLLFQVVFHARIAEEAGAFDFAAVAEAICAKMLRRHPHVFGDQRVDGSAEQTKRWEEIKRAEKAPSAGLLSDVPIGLPALTRAVKLGKRAATVGFDWPDVAGVRAKVDEELRETDAAIARGDADAIAAEIGDVLFSMANWCRHLGLEPESCLRAANARFTRRFGAVEAEVAASGRGWDAHDAESLEVFWRKAKDGEAR